MEQTIKTALQSLPRESALRLLYDDEQAFYLNHFNHFTSHVIREKKILIFENPNRMLVNYEYDVTNLPSEDSPLFVFLPDTKKNWLKVSWEGRRLAISSKEKVSKLIFEYLKKEVVQLIKEMHSEGSPTQFWDEYLWSKCEHIPCFIEGLFSEKEEKTGQLLVEYYDSFETFQHVGHKYSLFDERQYGYNYTFETGSSHWLYVKAPDKFQLVINTDDNRATEIKTNDPEIKAYKISQTTTLQAVIFQICIRVPRTLKWWYGLIAIFGLLYFLAFLIVSIILVSKGLPMTPVFAQVGISVIAAIIASRGWMMNDETILKKISLIMTAIAIAILVCLTVMYSISSFSAV